jgi:hypothetical protein
MWGKRQVSLAVLQQRLFSCHENGISSPLLFEVRNKNEAEAGFTSLGLQPGETVPEDISHVFHLCSYSLTDILN